MQNLDLNDIYLKSDEKAITLLNNVVSDKAGNIYINPAIISETNGKYIETYLDNLIDRIAALSIEFNEKGIADHNQELQFLMDTSMNMLSSLSSDDEIDDSAISGILSAFDELSNLFDDEEEPVPTGFSASKAPTKRGDSEELKNLKVKVDAAIAYSEKIHGQIDGIAKSIASIDNTLTKREKDKDYIFPDDKDTLGSEIIKIKNELTKIKKEVDGIKASDPIVYNIMDRTDPENLIYDKEKSLGFRTLDNIGAIALGIVILWLFIPYVLLSLFWERDRSSHDDTYDEFYRFLQELPGTPYLDDAFKVYFNLIKSLEDKYEALKRNYTVVTYYLDPTWIDSRKTNVVDKAKCYKYIEGDIRGNDGEVYKFYDWCEPCYLDRTYFLGIFGSKSEYTVPEPPAAPFVEPKFSTRIKYTLIKSGGDHPGAFGEEFGPWDDPKNGSLCGDPQPCESGSSLYRKLENLAPEGYSLDKIEKQDPCADDFHYNVIYKKNDDPDEDDGLSVKLSVSYAINSTIPATKASKIRNCYKIQYSNMQSEFPTFYKCSMHDADTISSYYEALTSIFSKDSIDAACEVGSIYSAPASQDGKNFTATRTHYAMSAVHTDVWTTTIAGEAKFYLDEDDIGTPGAEYVVIPTTATGESSTTHAGDTIISSTDMVWNDGDFPYITAPDIEEDLKTVIIDGITVLSGACWMNTNNGAIVEPGARVSIDWGDTRSGGWSNPDYCGQFGPAQGSGTQSEVPVTNFTLYYKWHSQN